MPTPRDPLARLKTTAKAGVWLSTFVLLILMSVIGYMVWKAVADPDQLSRIMTDQLGLMSPAPLLERPQALSLTALWLLTDMIAIAFLWQTRALFLGIDAHGICTQTTARRLRRIGWLVFAIGPASVVINLLSTMLLGFWRNREKLSGSIEISDTDFYAMVVGLVIVAVGHMMVDAARLDAENRAFV
jgi:hypothetical protein